MSDIIHVAVGGALDGDAAVLLRARLESALSRLAPSSRRAYSDALERFSEWLASWLPTAPAMVQTAFSLVATPIDPLRAVLALVGAGPLVAGHVADAYAAASSVTLAPASVALRLAALRFFIKTARDAGVIAWTLHVRGPRVEPLRDVRGPSVAGVRAMLEAAATSSQTPTGKPIKSNVIRDRDVVLVGFLAILGLRRGEAVSLDVSHYDADGRRLSVHGKGRGNREWISLPAALAERLDGYLAARGRLDGDAPLLASCDRAHRGSGRLTASGAYKRVVQLGAEAGIARRVSPHKLRHAGVTAGLDATGGDVRRVSRFARHLDPKTTIRYDDARQDHAGQIASLLAVAFGIAPSATSSPPTG